MGGATTVATSATSSGAPIRQQPAALARAAWGAPAGTTSGTPTTAGTTTADATASATTNGTGAGGATATGAVTRRPPPLKAAPRFRLARRDGAARSAAARNGWDPNDGDDYGHASWADQEAWAAFDILGTHQYDTQVAEPWPDDVPDRKPV